jgi:hypothetical protein
MHRIHEIYEKLVDMAVCEMERPYKQVDIEGMGEIIDMLKDIKEMKYYHAITEAMEDGEYQMTPEMFRSHSPEWYRDLDKHTKGIMYYTEPMSHGESKSEEARKKYHAEKTQENFDHYTRELMNELTDMWGTLDSAEKTMLKARVATLQQKMG